jgi:galactose mutarotase-like enzyme
VGRLHQDEYRLGNEIFHHYKHGFARNSEFELIATNNQQITFQLTSNDSTLPVYPFKFQLQVTYTLQEKQLSVSYQVTNPESQTTLPFSIGGHPAFTCPLFEDTKFEEYQIEFEQNENLVRHFLVDGTFSGETKLILHNENTINLSREFFERDAIILKYPKSRAVTLKHPQQGKVVTLHYPGFQHLGIWSKPEAGANYICLEPWYGRADDYGYTEDFRAKEGMILLPPKNQFQTEFIMDFAPTVDNS